MHSDERRRIFRAGSGFTAPATTPLLAHVTLRTFPYTAVGAPLK
jgi:hypothetical protein